ncbi:YczE/YyaS/YitT family protein [Lentilactobacillus parabuchneri]|uniref:YczE/YyaS/YitT family protein n=1 Tax=Lentilactobacillus parabuchneri TaxID=152331 RepID=UPI003F9D2826
MINTVMYKNTQSEAEIEPQQPSDNRGAAISLKTLMAFVGIALLSLGTTFLREGRVGLDPFTAMNTGIAAKIGLGLGNTQLISNLVIFMIVLLLDRKKIGIGTIMNMILVGYEIQWFTTLYNQILPNSLNFLTISADLIIGLLLFTLGSSMYMGASLGVAPYDAIAPILSTRVHLKYRVARIGQDILFMIAGFFIGGPVGIATIIVAFFTGPLITYWNSHVSEKLLLRINNFSAQPSLKNAGTQIASFGRGGYRTVVKAYQMTEQIQRHKSAYTDSQLVEQLNESQQQLKEAGQIYENAQRQYKILVQEAKKRGKVVKGNLPGNRAE